MAGKRVDEALVQHGLADSVEHARLLIMAGKVYQGGGKVAKPSDRRNDALALTVRDAKERYASRGGLKLEKALATFDVDVSGRVCLDVGASTGGFTDVLLQNGARMVYAVDVGFGLLAWRLRSDARVVVMEKTNARALTRDMFAPRPSLGVADVSFISLRTILPAVLDVLEGDDARFIALVKPQFEARREQVGAGGVVRDASVHEAVIAGVMDSARALHWHAHALDFSPITGADGNIEFLLELMPGASEAAPPDIPGVVRRAWDALKQGEH